MSSSWCARCPRSIGSTVPVAMICRVHCQPLSRRTEMKIRSQIGMVLNLDKCIGCHTCSITCKNVWTSREGMEYAWFNNVESKPGIGYPKEWENQDKWKGGWIRNADGSINPRIGGKFRVLANIFANPDLPTIDDYYEPFDFDYQHLHTAPLGEHQPEIGRAHV